MDVLELDKMDSINKYNKEIYALILTRDVRDVITSRHPNLPDEYFIGYENSWWPKNKEFTEWGYTAAGIGEIHKAIQNCEQVNGIKVIKIKYEDLVTKVDEVQARLEQFIDLKFSRQFKNYYNNKSRLAYRYEGRYKAKDKTLVMEDRPITLSRTGKWRDKKHAERVFDQFSSHPELFDILVADGYEEDNAWYEDYRH
ncbi:MAG: hypothetical protein KJO47_01240 [Gammaproteobacteria bacterium]|nr:hypothetical protein [Gammaproteobacteria bacterium]